MMSSGDADNTSNIGESNYGDAYDGDSSNEGQDNNSDNNAEDNKDDSGNLSEAVIQADQELGELDPNADVETRIKAEIKYEKANIASLEAKHNLNPYDSELERDLDRSERSLEF
ncbi:hypothetical protein AOQ84DRAFT_385791 [Glonium stellatum]|uniref:Uncharacterized protein n=1 Tax=Glonium stellatum TaxID=574774 RepID=A0A8E2F9N6_9PEZI|nr:hypothetical protein AOQ84DRAFT_385791 [Glonium stellatum]